MEKVSEKKFQRADLIKYGLFFDEVRPRRPGINEQTESAIDKERFAVILNAADRLIKDWIPSVEADTEPVINRTNLLAAFYYAYNDKHISDNDESVDLTSCKGRSFRSHYEQFRQEVNKLFDRVNFAPFSSKNLLDMLVVCSSYIYIYG